MEPANADLAEMDVPAESLANKAPEKVNEDPEEVDRQVRVSRTVEAHELENALCSLSQHGSRRKELLWGYRATLPGTGGVAFDGAHDGP